MPGIFGNPHRNQSFQAQTRFPYFWNEWQFDAFATRPIETKTGVFDDGPDPHSKFWGLYGIAPFPLLAGGQVDFYYLGVERDSAHFNQGTAHGLCHSIGTRLWGNHSGWDWNFEFVYQFGTFGDGDISAWTAASDTGCTFAHAPWTPRPGLKTQVLRPLAEPMTLYIFPSV